MTLGGLFLAIGPLVDNAIVVLENTHRHLGMGKSPAQAASDATGELTLPVHRRHAGADHRALPGRPDAGRGRLPVQAADPGRGLRHDRVVRPVVDVRAGALLEVAARPRSSWPPRDHERPQSLGFFARLYGRHQRGHRLRSPAVYARAARGRAAAPLPGPRSASACCSPRRWCSPGCIGQEFFPAVDAGQITHQVRGPSNLRLDATERRIIDVEKPSPRPSRRHELQMTVSEIGLEQRLVGRLLAERRPAGHGHPPATHAGADELGPAVRRSCCASDSPPTRSSPTWSSASTPAAWCRRR